MSGTFTFPSKWRMAIESAEAMTIFSVIQADFFNYTYGEAMAGILSTSIPNTYGSIWVSVRSPFVGCIYNIYLFIRFSSFWWTGLLPDFAMIRDRAIKPFQKKMYTILSFGWSGRAKDWQRFEEVSLVLAGWRHL